ncbi:hypothetical protein L1987_53141 [Smallanthus sonchifolius]|uniref:Uncharacterized protein n=1 Tax=Smallanthus sonchifolius TaxID=185202 RepID=A0ACB9EVF4_9ASTR|nr:hypothetical protein L1987_53141 [Smallanthus sonchifolius]
MSRNHSILLLNLHLVLLPFPHRHQQTHLLDGDATKKGEIKCVVGGRSSKVYDEGYYREDFHVVEVIVDVQEDSADEEVTTDVILSIDPHVADTTYNVFVTSGAIFILNEFWLLRQLLI